MGLWADVAPPVTEEMGLRKGQKKVFHILSFKKQIFNVQPSPPCLTVHFSMGSSGRRGRILMEQEPPLPKYMYYGKRIMLMAAELGVQINSQPSKVTRY